MKILVIQLARLGDIYTTWPILRALRRKYPDGRIDLLVRKRFSEACLGLDCVDQLHVLESDQVLEPVFKQQRENWWIESSSRLRTFTERISQNNYDRVINLSFSPFSSFLTKMVCSENSDVAGYSRYADGSFSVSDSMSGYFYSQVGIGRYNRIHLFDLFAMVSGVNLVPEDWSRPTYLVEKKPEKK